MILNHLRVALQQRIRHGETVTVRCPWDGIDGDGDTWLQGQITKTVAWSPATGYALHAVRVTAFKWAERDPWGKYDGVPQVLAREAPGDAVLVWVDTWPRR